MHLPTSIWHGCYGASWKGLIPEEAFTHPAKFARGLIDRIYRHGLASGYWKRGDLIGDPFGGVGCGGLVASWHGLKWVGVELEPRFVGIAERTLAPTMGLGRIVRGDSRKFAELVGRSDERVTSPPYQDTPPATNKRDGYSGVVTSPPYISGGHHPDQTGSWGRLDPKETAGYGATEGQIGKLPAGTLGGAVTSPPYADRATEKNAGTIDFSKNFETYKRSGGGSTFESYVATQTRHSKDYGHTEGQIADLAVRGEATETYWSAMAEVYAQCFIALRPGGVMAVVVKDYVKNKQRVPLSAQTLELLIRTGFAPLEWARASLVKEEALLGGGTKRTERKSFFRRLAEQKGSPRIDHEDVLFVRKNGPPECL